MTDKPTVTQVIHDAQHHQGCTVARELGPLVSVEEQVQFFNEMKRQAPNLNVDVYGNQSGFSFVIPDLLQQTAGGDQYRQWMGLDGKKDAAVCSEFVENAPTRSGPHAPIETIATNIVNCFERTHNGGKTDIDGKYLADQLKGLSIKEETAVFNILQKHNIAADINVDGQTVEFKIDSSNRAIKWYDNKINLANGTHSEFYYRGTSLK